MTATRTIHVRCTFTIPVEVPDDPEYDAVFDIEENHCPGTGRVGAVLERYMDECGREGICWACQLGGENKIVTGERKGSTDKFRVRIYDTAGALTDEFNYLPLMSQLPQDKWIWITVTPLTDDTENRTTEGAVPQDESLPRKSS